MVVWRTWELIAADLEDLYVARWREPSRCAELDVAGWPVSVLKWNADANPEEVALYATVGGGVPLSSTPEARILVSRRVNSYSTFDRVALFNPDSGHLTEFSRGDATSVTQQPQRGAYAMLGRQWVVLYRSDEGVLRLRIGVSDFALTSANRVAWRQTGALAELEVSSNDVSHVLSYRSEPLPEGDPTPFVEAEDFDFGLFVANIARDRERASRLYR